MNSNLSSFIPITCLDPILQTNKRQFLRLIDSLDPIDFDVACDFDFWLWIDSQKYFAPFSYKTHNLNVLSLQGMNYSFTK